VFEIDLPRDGLVSRRNGGDALGDLYRIEPHAGRIAQAVGSAQAAHDRAVLVENLGVSTGQTEHLDLTGARNGVAVSDRNRSGVFEALGEIAAGHLAQPREGDHFVLGNAVAFDEVAAHRSLHDHVLDLHSVRSEDEIDTLRARFDAKRIVHKP